jgi:hypothetical protein
MQNGMSLIASNPKEFSTSAMQQFVAEASLLARKWQDKIEHFQEGQGEIPRTSTRVGPFI